MPAITTPPIEVEHSDLIRKLKAALPRHLNDDGKQLQTYLSRARIFLLQERIAIARAAGYPQAQIDNLTRNFQS